MTLNRLSILHNRHRYGILFFSLIATIAVAPLADKLGPESKILEAFISVNLVAAVLGSWLRRAPRLASGLVVLLLLSAILHLLPLPDLVTASEGAWVVIGMAVIIPTARTALQHGAVDNERIFAALSAYILSGLVFAVGYAAYESQWPGSFQTAHGGSFTLRSAIYFSYVTLATLGYGDIVPASDPARGLAILEALGGQMYLTVLVARLVSLYSSHERSPSGSR